MEPSSHIARSISPIESASTVARTENIRKVLFSTSICVVGCGLAGINFSFGSNKLDQGGARWQNFLEHLAIAAISISAFSLTTASSSFLPQTRVTPILVHHLACLCSQIPILVTSIVVLFHIQKDTAIIPAAVLFGQSLLFTSHVIHRSLMQTTQHKNLLTYWMLLISVILFGVSNNLKLLMWSYGSDNSYDRRIYTFLSAICIILCMISYFFCYSPKITSVFYSIFLNSNHGSNNISFTTFLDFSATLSVLGKIICLLYFDDTSVSSFYRAVTTDYFILICFGCLKSIILFYESQNRYFAVQAELDYKNTFVRYISHEIRSPISTITLGIDLLVNNLDGRIFKRQATIETLRELKLSCDIATNTLNNLLAVEKIKSNMMTIEESMVHGWTFLVTCVRPFCIQAESQGIDLSLTLEHPEIESKYFVYIDKFKVEQVVRNFLSNALKFTPSGGLVSVTMQFRSSQYRRANNVSLTDINRNASGVLRFSVKDSGAGISLNDQVYLFGQYVQINASKLQGGNGTGLGLWLSKKIIEMHGGAIGVESQGEGMGSTFFFELPCFKQLDCEVKSISIPRNMMGKKSNDGRIVGNTHSNASRLSSFSDQPEQLPNPSADGINNNSGGGSDEARGFAEIERRIQMSSHSVVSSLTNSFISAKDNVYHGINTEAITESLRRISLRGPTAVIMETSSRKDDTEDSFCSRDGIAEDDKFGIAGNKTVPTQDARLRKLSEESIGSVTSMRNKRLCILIVDDSLLSRKMVDRALQAFDYKCLQAKNGEEAIVMVKKTLMSSKLACESGDDIGARTAELVGKSDDMIAAKEKDVENSNFNNDNGSVVSKSNNSTAIDSVSHFDAILMDCYMPKLSGIETTLRLRSMGYTGVIIGLTGSDHHDDIEAFKRNGANDVFIKPLDFTYFNVHISAAIKSNPFKNKVVSGNSNSS